MPNKKQCKAVLKHCGNVEFTDQAAGRNEGVEVGLALILILVFFVGPVSTMPVRLAMSCQGFPLKPRMKCLNYSTN